MSPAVDRRAAGRAGCATIACKILTHTPMHLIFLTLVIKY